MYAAPIQTGELRETDLPNSWGEWSDYARFALTFSPEDRRSATEARRAPRLPVVRAAEMAFHGA